MDVIDLVDAIHVHPELVVSPFGRGELGFHGSVGSEVGDGHYGQNHCQGRDGLARDG